MRHIIKEIETNMVTYLNRLVDWSGRGLTPGGLALQTRPRRSVSDEEAWRTPPGKQAPGAEINGFYRNSIQK